VRVFKMIQEGGVLQPLEMQTQSQMTMNGDARSSVTLTMMSDELNINKEAISSNSP
jgi:hypothetical protein